MKIKSILFVSLALLFLNSQASVSSATDYSTKKIDITVTEVPYHRGVGFDYTGLEFQSGSNLFGGYMTGTSAGDSGIQRGAMFGYRSITMIEGNSNSGIGSFDMMLGGTFFPKHPSFSLFNLPVRIKVSLLGGMGLAFGLPQSFIFTACANAALVFSSADDPSGLTVGVAYWPSLPAGNIKLPASLSASVGFLFGPRAE